MTTEKNIDFDEVHKFASLSTSWWDETGEFKTLHDINPVRLAYIQEQTPIKNKNVLDIGCGGGLLAEAMASQEANVTAIDASSENIQIARHHAQQTELKIDYQTSLAEEFSESHSNHYDVITCMELLEHVPEPRSVISACTKMIKPGGHVILSTINRNLKAYLQAVLAAEYLLKLLPRGTHHYEKFIRPSELVNWCQEEGLMVNDISGLKYNPLLNSCSLTNTPDVNYLIDTIAAPSS